MSTVNSTPPHVLVIDDDPRMQRMVGEVLDLIPGEMTSALSGERGLALLREAATRGETIDAVLLDVIMPNVDGFRILEVIKSDPVLEQIPVILVTGVGEVREKARGLEMGADDYITKPFDPQELLARIKAVLRIRRSEQLLRRRNQELAALNTISNRAFSSLDVDELLASTLSGLGELVRAEALAFVLDDGGDRWVVRASLRADPDAPALEGLLVPLEGSGLAEILEGRQPALRVGTREGFWNASLGRVALDEAHLPLIVQDEVVGQLTVLAQPETLGEDRLPLLRNVAATVSAAVENARLYEELAAFAEELERSQSQLIQAEKMAAVGRLAASIAHEINNPLQAIQNSLHLFQHPEIDEQGRRSYLNLAEREVERLVQIVRRMLDFYRPATGSYGVLDINSAVQNALAVARKQLQEANIRVVVRLSQELPSIWGSKNQLTQVFLNIVLNAIEAIAESGTLWIGTAHDPSKDELKTVIRDNGRGIAPEIQEHLFEPFHTTKSQGTGLGLAVSYSIVERHRGTIEVESQADRGTTFVVRLPPYRGEG
jgi:signal transduction histidine kinase/DNA-binding response OmpR family regulator